MAESGKSPTPSFVHYESSAQFVPPTKAPTPPATLDVSGDSVLRLEGEQDPMNWKLARKWLLTIIIVLMTGTIAFCSSIYTAAIIPIADHYGTTHTVSTLGVSTFLLGFAVGPLLFAPLSELWGRNKVYRLVLPVFLAAQVGCALSPNIGALLSFRFLSGFFGSPTVTNSGGSLTDLWPQSHRSVPLALFSAASFLGPVIAPVVGGFVCEYISWKFCFWLVLILGGAVYVAMLLFLPETYAPKLLADFHCNREKKAQNKKDTIKQTYYTNLTRPWLMLFTEPILFLLSTYMAFVYAVLYLDFTAYPIVYSTARSWSPGISGLSFLGIGVGMAISTALSPLVNRVHTLYVQKLSGPAPEARLPHLIITSWLIPIGLFWFAWTALPPTHWISSILAGVPFGAGLVLLFLGITAYLIDCYGKYAASALAANAVLRSVFGAAFPLFAKRMYEAMGTPWATSLLGFVAVAMAPLPWVFYRWGPKLRAASAFHQRTLAGET